MNDQNYEWVKEFSIHIMSEAIQDLSKKYEWTKKYQNQKPKPTLKKKT